MRIFKKLFCLHNYRTHAKKKYTWSETRIVEGTEFWIKPNFEIINKEKTNEVLICRNCGKIKELSY